MTSSPTVTLPYHQRGWIDAEPGQHDQSSFEVSKKIIRLIRHDSFVPRYEYGAVEFRILAPMFASRFASSPHWSTGTWLNYLQKGCGPKKGFHYCLDPYSAETFLYLRANQSNIARQRVVTERFRRVHLPRWTLPRCALHDPIRVAKRQERVTCDVLYGREPKVHRSLLRKGTTT